MSKNERFLRWNWCDGRWHNYIKGRYLILFVIAICGLFCPVETVPSDSPGCIHISQPVNWSVQETPGCPYGYQCRYGTWVPQITVNTPVWVFGITNQDQCGGVINLREYPDYPCQQSCSEYIPGLYMCEVVYVPFDGGEYLPEDLPLTYIPAGQYVPDGTQKPVTDWVWNDEKNQYQYVWDFTNDDTACSTPTEGKYTAEVYVKKKYYRDMRAHTDFYVCYHAEIDLEFDKDPPEYLVEEEVKTSVYVKKEDKEPVNSGVESILILPDGSQITDLEWTLIEDGTYTTTYAPIQEGEYTITVKPKEDVKCYLEKASGTFYVRDIGEGEFSCSLSEEEIDNLAHKYAPYMYFYRGFWGEEKYFPTRVEVMLQNSTFWEFGVDTNTKITEYDYSAEYVGEYTDPDHYLDLDSERCTIDSDLIDEQGNLTMYYRVVCYRYEGETYIVIQYRPFSIFNNYLNKHEGDWEMVEVLLDYYTRDPLGAAYSGHLDGEYRFWDDIEKEGTHPVVYIALGSLE